MKSDDRRLKILQIVVDSYIRTGEPIGSKTVAALMNNEVSSATIRNDMAMLERLGFLEQPHTSAGRIPTYLGYRIYINKLMRPSGLSEEEKHRIDTMLQREKHPLTQWWKTRWKPWRKLQDARRSTPATFLNFQSSQR